MKILHNRVPLSYRIDNYTLYDFDNLSTEDIYFINEYYINDLPNDKKHRYMIVSIDRETKNFKFEFYDDYQEILKKYKGCYLFKKEDKSKFNYWFAHWCAFNMTALNIGIWKFKYLFHDIEKPFLRLFLPYDKVKKIHRKYNKHHLEYGIRKGFDKVDWEALMIDWECSQYSKLTAPRDFKETVILEINNKWKDYKDEILKYTMPLIEKYYM